MFTKLIIKKQKKITYQIYKRIFHNCLYKFSSNRNEVIRSVLNFFLLLFFYKKVSQAQKSAKLLTTNKNKKIRIKNI